MKKMILSALRAGAVTAGTVTAALAAPQQTTIDVSGIESPALVLGEVTVTAQRLGTLPARSVLTSVDIAGAELLARQNVDYAWELLGRMPGVMLTDFNQGTTSGKFSLRAFNGEGEVNAVKLLIDGVPANSNDGNMPYIDVVFPLDIAAIEVVRGTNDPRHGLHNIAGNANIVTRTGGDYMEARLGYGGRDAIDAQAAVGHESDAFAQNYFAAWRRTDGYRDHAESRRYTVAGKWFANLADGRHRLGLIARHYHNEAAEPGYLTLAGSRSDPKQSYAFSATDGGDRDIDTLSLHLELGLAAGLDGSLKVYRNRFDDQRFVKFSAGVSQQERVTDELHWGVLGALTWRPAVQALHALELEWGFDAEWQDNESRRYLTLERVRQSTTRDQKFDLDMRGTYLQAVIQPVEALRFVPAYRIDHVGGSFTNNLGNATYDVNDYGTIRQPKLSAVMALAPGYSIYGNWGRTFQIGVTAAAYKITPRVTDLGPSMNEGWEFGLKFAPRPWLNGRIAWWRQTASNEVRRRLNDPSGDSDNIGKTRRQGLDLQVNLSPHESLDLWLAWAWQDSKILVPDPAAPASLGREIDHVPHHVFSAGIEWQATEALRFSAGLNGQSDYWLERNNVTPKYGDSFNLQFGAAWRVNPQLEVEFQAKNVTDDYYEYAWWDGVQSLHSPADGRAIYGAVKLTF